jgi:hypothetical protein
MRITLSDKETSLSLSQEALRTKKMWHAQKILLDTSALNWLKNITLGTLENVGHYSIKGWQPSRQRRPDQGRHH